MYLLGGLLFFCLAYVSVGLAGVAVNAKTTKPCLSWGLHFSAEGQPPSPPMDSKKLRDLGGLYLVDGRCICLTFDAGFENGHTADILDTLQKRNVKATFFLTGHYVRENAPLVKRMLAEGHLVGNHTENHPDMARLDSFESFAHELEEFEKTFFAATGRPLTKLYRPPGGKTSEPQLEYAKKLGYTTVFWSLAYVDWQQETQPSREYALGKLYPRMHEGAILLLHSTSATNASILDELIEHWQAEGYLFILPSTQ